MYRIFVNFRCISLILVMNYLEKKNLFVSAKDEIEAPFSKMRGPKITMTLLETTIYHVVRCSRPVQQSEPSQVLLELQTLARSWSSSIALDDQENYSKIIFFSCVPFIAH